MTYNSPNPTFFFHFFLKVTSKGAGLNPNAKVWQEIPVAPSEAVPSSPHWPPSDISECAKPFHVQNKSP